MLFGTQVCKTSEVYPLGVGVGSYSSFVIGMNESSCDDLNCTISSQEVRKSH